MSDIKKIMVAVAFSKYTPAIINYAAKLAMDLKAQLIVAHVINVRDVEAVGSVESLGYSISTEDYVKGIKEERMSEIDKMVSGSPLPKGEMKVIIRVGHPFDGLMKIVKEEGVDMVVMGTKGRSDLEYVILGSVAEKMIRHSPVPVVSYRGK